MKRIVSAVVGIVLLGMIASGGEAVTDTAMCPLPHSPYVAFRGRVDLPADGLWHVRTPTDETVVQIYLTPPSEIGRRLQGRRMTAAVRQQRIDQGRWKVRMPYHACLSFARDHNATGPAAIGNLDAEEHRYIVDYLQSFPWGDWNEAVDGERPDGPFVFLVPGAKFHFADVDRQVVPAERRELLAVELRPYVNDGKHWVLYTDGSTVREPIDKTRVEHYQLAIRPVVDVDKEETLAAQPTLAYTLVAVRNGSVAKPFEVRVFNSISGDEQQRTWAPANAPQDKQVLAALREARAFAWQPYLRTGPAPTLRSWLASPAAVDADETSRPGDNLTAFSLLGGRAAIEETLQMQDLQPVGQAKDATIEVSSLTGVEVQSHPFAEMLGGQPGGQLSLANAVPADRFFVYVAKPEAMLPFLDKGAGFAAAAGAGWTGNRLDYDLTRRYLQRLGVSRSWLEAVLKSGVLQDMAVVMPDLLLIDGTDVTVVARLKQPELLAALLPLAGIQGLSSDGVSTIKTGSGRETSWALRGDLLCISSHRSELGAVLRLIATDGVGSLGRSDEFRYMLTQVPVKPETRMLAYFSDPFVRRIVGPEVKLGQLRRVQARAQMELLTSQALLARLDGVPPVESVADLIRMKYLPAGFPTESYSIDAEGMVRSAIYGSLDDMKTLREVPVERVTQAEADVYKRYVENYSRFWRQFFDPIAIRLDDAPDRSLELTTFILPLIDNTIYNRLREMTLRHEDRKPLVIPRIEPSPVLQFSVNLGEKFWEETAGGFAEFFRHYGGASPALLDDLGPALHLAVFDADPVIALGSGDAMGAFGGNALRGGNDMLFLAPALSLLTRPCTILIETRDPEQTARYLRQAANAWTAREDRGGGDEFRVSFYQVDGRDSWVWTMNFVGVIKLRFGVEVADRYLVIRNIPWAVGDRVVRADAADLKTAGLSVWPAASRLELPGLFASAADQERRAAMSAAGRLVPLIQSGAAVVETAEQRHRELFGFRPLHPPAGQWIWQDGNLTSSVYGSAWRQRQPSFDPERPFGLMQSVESMQLNMQFEDAGLRSVIRWKLRPAP